MQSLDELKDRARRGDAEALRELRERGFFDQKRPRSYPVSDAQRRLWVLDQMNPEAATYNVPGAIRLYGPLQADAFARALTALVERHESLRTSVALIDGEARQVVHPGAAVALTQIDVTTRADAVDAARAWIAADAAEPFSLAVAPLVRCALVRLAEDDHIFSCTLHHIVCDGWSLSVLFRELLVLYQACVQGTSNPLPPLRIQYKDVTAWQRRRVDEGALDAAREFWRQQLAGEHPPLAFPADFPRPAVQAFAGATVEWDLPGGIVDSLERVAAGARVTLFTALLAATRVLLARYTGQTDVIVGVPVSGRSHADLENQVGFYVNLVPLRTEVQPSDTFADVVARVRQATNDAYAHDYPFDRLVDDLNLARDLSRSPLFDVLVTWDEDSGADGTAHGLRIEPFTFDSPIAKYDLTFFFSRWNGSVRLALNYSVALFTRETIERVVRHFGVLLQGIVSSAGTALRDLPMTASGELARVVDEFSGGSSPYPRDRSIADVFSRQATATPDAVAVIAESRDGTVTELTYGVLDAKAERVAARLRSLGVRLESRVGVLLDRSERVPIALLGILKAGGCYVPLDPAAPCSRLEYVAGDAECVVIVSEPATRMRAGLNTGAAVAGVQCVDIANLESSGETDHVVAVPESGAHGRSLAYVMYTSGSTGLPKGTLIEQRSVLRLVLGSDFLQLGAGDRVLQTGSLAFDASTLEIWGPLLNGGCVCFAPAEDMLVPAQVRALISRHRITAMWATSSLFNQWVDADPDTVAGLAYLLVGGERLSRRHIERVRQRHPDVVLINGYGPTENTTFTACHRIERIDRREIPIGRPIANTQIYVLDEWGGPCGVGVPGEICAGGDGLARGYLRRPDLTAERFVPHPVAAGERLYRTGDLGRWQPDGTLEFLGRRDTQVKIRGYRVELAEIEARFHEHRDVRDAAVIARESSSGPRELLGYFVAARPLTPAALRKHLARTLPDYMLPARIVRLEQMPLTVNGKLDRAALPDPDLAADGHEHYEPPRTPTERALAGIWSDVLQRPDVGIHDNFFDLGGHSLKATRVLTRIHRDVSARLTLRDIFAAPTIAGLAQRVDESGAGRRIAIARVADADRYPASHAQRRLWLLERLSDHSAAYNVPGAVVLDGPLDVAALSAAFSRLVERHESLRTSFSEIDGELYQHVGPPADVSIPVVDVAGQQAPEETARELAVAEATGRFVLTDGPLFRVTLFRLAHDRHVFCFNLHHIITDGWSMRVLLDELIALYREAAHGEPAQLPTPALQYRDFAVWQHDYLASPDADAHRRYWIDQFSTDPPPLELPADAPRPAIQTFRGDVLRFRFDPGTIARLRALGREHGATLYMVWLAIVRVLIARHSGQQEFVLGTGVSGREHADLADQVGFYVNMLPLRQRLTGSDTFAELLRQTRDTVTEALEHQSYPFDCLVSDLQVRRELGRQPLFDVVVTLEEGEDTGRNTPGLRVSPFDLSSPFSKFDLMFAFNCPAQGGCEVALEYSTDLFRADRMRRMAAHFEQLVLSVLEDATTRADAIHLLPARERRLLAHFAVNPSAYPSESTIVDLFEAQVARHYDRPAVASGSCVLTYDELNRRANRLAHRLRADGVKPEDAVGVLLDRSEHVAVALVGILKAGGCYLPLDASAPSDRLAFMIDDAGCRVVVDESYTRGTGENVAWLENPARVPGATSRSLAYVMYTSGSTGRPKGTLIEQRSISRLVLGANYLQLGPDDRMLQTGSLAFDASTLEIWGPLLTGGCVCFAPADTLLDSKRVAAAIARHGVTAMFVTTSLFNQLVDADDNVFAGLRCLMTGGEKVSVAHINRVRRRYPGLALLHVYGPTENTTFTTFYPVEQEHALDVPIGRPLSNTSVYVLDDAGGLCPIGVAGEICTGGDGLARGYLNRADFTAERFVPAAWGSGERFYRTGDVGRWSADGEIEFLGRRDNQVKIRGYRVEPEEVEARLLQHPAVVQAAILTRETTVGTRELVAYYAGGEEATEGAVRAHLAATLPAYMIPGEIIRRDRLPLNRSGKVDRAVLRSEALVVRTEAPAVDPPRTEAERVLADVWQAVLGREQVGRHDHYFDSGGDSIRAIQIVNRLRKAGWTFDVREVFQHPVLHEAAERLTTATRDRAAEAPAGPVPLTPIQRWFLTRAGDLHHFNHAVLLTCPDDLKTGALREAISALRRHHQALRLALTTDDSGQPVAMTDSGPASALDDLFAIREITADSDEAWHRDMESVQRGFRLQHGPLFKAILYQRPEGDRLLLVAHHLIVDGVSWRILLEDLAHAYRACVDGVTPSLTPQVHSYAQWAEALLTRAERTSWRADHVYWSTVCAETGAVIARDATETSTTGLQTYGDCESVELTLSRDTTAALLEDSHAAFSTTVDDLLLTAVGRAVAGICGGDRTWIAMEGHGREALKGVDVSGAVGWFTSVFPLLLRTQEQDPVQQVRAVKESVRMARRHALGYSALRWLAAAPAFDAPAPECRISVNYMGQFEDSTASATFALAPEASGTPIAANLQREQDFEIGGIVRHGVLTLSVTYNTRLHAEATARRLLDGVGRELESVVDACCRAERGLRTPSDYTACTLSVPQYDALLQRHGWHARDLDDIFPLTPMQQGLLFQSLLDQSSRAYFLQLNYRMRGPLDGERFQEAWREVARRHAILRTAIVHEDVDQPLQVILRDGGPELTFVDLSAHPIDERERRVDEWRREDMARGVDVQRDALMRLAILRIAPDLHHVVWSYHHVMLDGWSLGVLYREFLQTYRALVTGGRRALAPPQAGAPAARSVRGGVEPFSRYVAWLLEQDPDVATAFWQEYLEGYEPTPFVEPLAAALAVAVPKRDEERHTTGEHTLTLSRDVSQRLFQLASSMDATINTLVQTLWAVLMARYTGAREVAFGAVVSGRPPALPGVEDMVGLFINTVPVRVEIDGTQSFRETVQRVQRDALRAEPFHFFPLADIQANHGADRQLFDHLLVFENYPLDTGATAGRDDLRVESFEAHDRTHYDLDLTIVTGEQLQIRFAYNPALFTSGTIARLAAQYDALASTAVADIEQPVAALSMLAPGERNVLLDIGRGPVREYPVETPLQTLFERVAAAHAGDIAVVSGDRLVTYAQLNARANRMANWLLANGVKRGDVVGTLDRRGIDLVASMIAILKCGATFLPLEPEYPIARLRYMLSDSGVRTLITRTSVLSVVDTSPPTLRTPDDGRCVLDLDRDTLDEWPAENLPPIGGSRDNAYLIYTSGSTGVPKGAFVRNDGTVNHIYAESELLGFHPGTAFLQSAPCSSDVAVWQCLAPGLLGGRVVVAEHDVVLDGERLFDLVKRAGVTFFEFVPVVLKGFLDHAATLAPEARALPALQNAMVTGEAVPAALINQWMTLYPDIALINSYGPTEAADDVCQAVFTAPLPADIKTVPIGQPLPNFRMYVLDERRQLVPVGVPGEICLSGIGVGPGYLNQEARTAAVFVPNPFAEHQHDTVLYRTGDRGRWRADGALECLGRFDQQVKVRGVRIELEEVESRLLEHPDVRHAAAGVRAVDGEPALVAWVAGAAAPAALRDHLSAKLPPAMVPTYFVMLESLPLLPNGKIDRRSCPDPDAPAAPVREYAEPNTPAARHIAQIWRDVLQLPRIGLNDNFFELGGHSLKAMQAVSRIHRDLGTRISLQTFFQHPTLEALSECVGGAEVEAFVAIVPAPPAADYALSHAQSRLWLQHHLQGEVAYNMPEAVLLEEAIDRSALERAFATLLERHEVLRTAFVVIEGEPRQRIFDAVAFTIREVDLTDSASIGEAEARAASAAAEEAAIAFDLTRPPLVRATLYRLDQSRAVFLMVMHHIVGDGWSMNVLYREVLALYDAYRRGEPNPLPQLRIQYKDFACWQNRQDFTRDEEYWVAALAGAPDRLALPYDTVASGDRDFRGKTEAGELDAGTVARLKALADAQGTTMSSVVLALFQLVLYQWTRQTDFCVGLAIANRNRAELENLIGFFVNILPIRTQLSSEMDFAALVEQVSARTREAFEHQEYPFDRLVQRLNPGREGNRQPLLNVIYAFQNFEDVAIDIGMQPAVRAGVDGQAGALVRPFAVPFETSKLDLTLFVTEIEKGLRLSLEYDTRLFRHDTIRRVIAALERFARMATAASEQGR